MKFGYIKSPDDHRDWMYRSIFGKVALPEKHLPDRLPVRDQGTYGTCVGFAGAYIKQAQERVNHPGKNYTFSPTYLYTECKKIDGIAQEGTTLRDAYKIMSKQGVCREQLMPYSLMGKQLPNVSQEAHADAKRFMVDKGYARLMSLEDIKQALLQSPVMIGVLVTESFAYPENGHVYVLPNGRWLGGHGMCADGYDDNREYTYRDGRKTKGFLRVVNSWGKEVGDEGYWWIPYEYINFRDPDIGMPYFQEAFVGLDILMPNTYAQKVELWLNSTRAVIDGEEIQLEQPPTLEPATERTLLPVRFLSEVFGYKVEWNAVEKKITITKP